MGEIVNKEKFENLLKTKELVIVDFFATWCGPCQMFIPIFDKLASEEKEAVLIKVDIDQENELAMNSKITGVPTIVAYKNGQEVGRFSGFRPLEDLKNFIATFK